MSQTTARVAAVHDVGPDSIALAVEAPPDFDALPGQFVKVSADLDGDRESRFYTISSPDVTDTFELTVEIDPEGTLGPWLAAREPGDELAVDGPYGSDHYGGEARSVVLAGGPGIGPAIGIAERAIADGNAAAIVYRNDGVVHEDRLAALATAGVPVFVVGADEDVAPATAAALEGGGQVFIYGFADFLDVATAAVDEAGDDPEAAKVENFG